MILKCPKCNSSDNLQIERRLNGEITCLVCGSKDSYSKFKFRTQHLEKIFALLTELAEKDLRLGQIFSILETTLSQQKKDIFYVEGDELLQELEKIFKD